MRRGLQVEISLLEGMRIYLSSPKVVRFLLGISLVQLATHPGGRRFFCPDQRRQTSWTVDAACDALLDGQCVTEHDFPSGKA